MLDEQTSTSIITKCIGFRGLFCSIFWHGVAIIYHDIFWDGVLLRGVYELHGFMYSVMSAILTLPYRLNIPSMKCQDLEIIYLLPKHSISLISCNTQTM